MLLRHTVVLFGRAQRHTLKGLGFSGPSIGWVSAGLGRQPEAVPTTCSLPQCAGSGITPLIACPPRRKERDERAVTLGWLQEWAAHRSGAGQCLVLAPAYLPLSFAGDPGRTVPPRQAPAPDPLLGSPHRRWQASASRRPRRRARPRLFSRYSERCERSPAQERGRISLDCHVTEGRGFFSPGEVCDGFLSRSPAPAPPQ